MKTLYLLRHAKSSWDNEGLKDFERPLAVRGKRACTVLNKALPRLGVAPEVVLCSAARRAQETLRRIAAGLPEEPTVIVERGLYLAGAKRLLNRLHKLDAAINSAMVIGHNPGLQRLALLLAGSGERSLLERLKTKLPTAGLAELRFQGVFWGDLEAGACTLSRLWTPHSIEHDQALTRSSRRA